MDPKQKAQLDMFYSLMRALNEAGIAVSFSQLMDMRLEQMLVEWAAAGIRFERRQEDVRK